MSRSRSPPMFMANRTTNETAKPKRTKVSSAIREPMSAPISGGAALEAVLDSSASSADRTSPAY